MNQVRLTAVNGKAYFFSLNDKRVSAVSYSNVESINEFLSLFERVPTAHGRGLDAVYTMVLGPNSVSSETRKQELVNAVLEGKVNILQQPDQQIIQSNPVPSPLRPSPVQSEPQTPGGRSDISPSSEPISSNDLLETDLNDPNKVYIGDPVAMSNGEEVLQLTDVKLKSEISLLWRRTYRSSLCTENIGMGFGWRSNFHLNLWSLRDNDGNYWKFADEQGRNLRFEEVSIGQKSGQIRSGAVLHYRSQNQVNIRLSTGRTFRFRRVVPDNIWLLERISEGVNVSFRLNYSSNFRLIEVNANDHLQLKLRYDLEGRLIEVISDDTNHHVVYVQYEYDSEDHLVKATRRGQDPEIYQYKKGLLTKRTLPSGYSYDFTWYGNGPSASCASQKGQNGDYVYSFVYPSHQTSEATNSLNDKWIYEHDSNGQLIKKVSPLGRSWSYQYDSLQRCISETYPNGSVAQKRYNREGNISAYINSNGEPILFEYNIYGQLAEIHYPNGYKVNRTHNSLGLLLSESDSVGMKREYTYDKYSRLISMVDNQEAETHFWWNEQNQLVAKQVGDAVTRFSYASDGKLNGEINAMGCVSFYQFHENGKLAVSAQYSEEHASSQSAVEYNYDNSGRLCSVTDQLGLTTSYVYSGLSQPEKQINPDGSWLKFGYDKERKLTSILRSDGNQFFFRYDADENVTQTVGFDGLERKFEYDATGKISQMVEGTERFVQYKRNTLGQLIERRSQGINGQFVCDSYHYDCMGRIVVQSTNGRTILRDYYLNGEIKNDVQGKHKISHRLDTVGRRKETTLPDGTAIEYTYNQHGKFKGVLVNGESILSCQYNNAGRESGRLFKNAQLRQSWDVRGCLVGQQCLAEWYQQIREYQYDDAKQITEISDSVLGGQKYHYDKLGQLSAAELDSFANHKEFEYSSDKLMRSKKGQYCYDEYGNQVIASLPETRQERVFDGLNQLTRLSHNGTITQYSYDGFGRRYKKVGSNAETQFIWDRNTLIGEYTHGEYCWYIYEPNTHRPLLMIQNNQVYCYQLDHRGTPIGLVNEQGKHVWQASHQAYGQVERLLVNEVNNPLRLQGQYYDAESGLHYNLHRYYCPIQKRYIQQDPIGIEGGINPYRYTKNPLSEVDPLGLCPREEFQVDPSLADPLQVLIPKTLSELYQYQDGGNGMRELINVLLENNQTRQVPEEDQPICERETWTMRCQHGERNFNAMEPSEGNVHNRLAVVGKDTIHITQQGNCGFGKTDCPAIKIVGPDIEKIERASTAQFDVFAPSSSGEQVASLKDFLASLSRGYDSYNRYQFQSLGCSGSQPKAEVWAYDPYEWDGRVTLGYFSDNWQVKSTLKGRMGTSNWSLAHVTANGTFANFLNEINGIIKQVSSLVRSEKNDHGYEAFKSGFDAPKWSIGGNMSLVERAQTPDVGLKGRLDLKFEPLIGFSFTADIITAVVKKVFPGKLADPILAARRSADKGMKSKDGSTTVSAKVEIELAMKGRIDLLMGWDFKPDGRCLPTVGADASKADAGIGLSLKGSTNVSAEVFIVKFQIGSEMEATGIEGAQGVGLSCSAYATEIDNKPGIAGKAVFSGLKLVYSYFLKVVKKVVSSGESYLDRTGYLGSAISASQVDKKVTGEKVILMPTMIFNTGREQTGQSLDNVQI
ncbi:RHS repeat-associated core domain-containing protein [Vibrio atypicus]|uniref:RHS repeat-associated core domain-containing protein n=1 Tax=Vibrio atypicus TaxID=558271 RepID=UPI0037356CE3